MCILLVGRIKEDTYLPTYLFVYFIYYLGGLGMVGWDRRDIRDRKGGFVYLLFGKNRWVGVGGSIRGK